MELKPSFISYRLFRRAIVVTVTALIVLISAFSTWKAISEYRLTIKASELQTRGYARALREHAERSFGEADRVLWNAIGQINSHGGITSESSDHLREILLNHSTNLPQIGSMVLINRQGTLFAHTLNTPIQESQANDREFYLYHRSHPDDDAPYISKPFKSRLTGKWRFTISHPIRSSQGVFEGVIAAGFEMEYFQKFYSSLELGKMGRVVMMRTDGSLILAEPFNEKDYSVDFKKSHLMRTYLPHSPKGTFHIAPGKALLEPNGRIISYDSLVGFPLVAMTNVGIDEITAPWHRNTILQAILTLAACMGLIALTLVLLRQIRRIEQAYVHQTEQQAEITAATERYRLLVDNLPVVIWQTDEHATVRYVSSAVTQIDGYTPEEVYVGGGNLKISRIHADDRDAVVTAFKALFSSGSVFDVEYRLQHKDGHWIWIHDFAYATVLLDGLRVAHGVFSDITARKQAEDERDQLELQLRQAQKMEAIGHLAGGVAHDFNNLLTPILGYAEMVRSKLPDGNSLASKLSGIIMAANRAKELTQQLLSFGRRQSIATEIIELNEVILTFNTILRRTIRESIRIDLELDPEGAYIKADRLRMEQVILNMTVNAQDAFNDAQGRITIATCKIRMDGENARLHPGMLPGDYVLLSFRDNGCGMSPEVMNHIFEPFFTTKQVGHGTGLGLATVYGIVKQHDAFIGVTSREGEGTTFRIYFPGCASVPLLAPETAVVTQAGGAGEAKILVVEDNDMVREMVTEMLENVGYSVLSAADPHLAIELLATGANRINLLVSDVVMPGLNGPELYEQLVVQYPDLKVIYISGYPINPSLRGRTLEDEINYLQKPFTAEALLERVRQVL